MNLPHLFNFDAPLNPNQRPSFSISNFPPNFLNSQLLPGLGSDIASFQGSNANLNYLIGAQNNALRTLGFGEINGHIYDSPIKYQNEYNDHEALAAYPSSLLQSKNVNKVRNQVPQAQITSSKTVKIAQGKNEQKKNKQKSKLTQNKQNLFPSMPETVEVVDIESDEYLSPVQAMYPNDKLAIKPQQPQINLSFTNKKEEGINQIDYFNILKGQDTPFSSLNLDHPFNPQSLSSNYPDLYFLNELFQNDITNQFKQLQQPKPSFNAFQTLPEPQLHYQQKPQPVSQINKQLAEPILIVDSPECPPINHHLNEDVSTRGPSMTMGAYSSFNYPVNNYKNVEPNKAIEISTFNPRLEETIRGGKNSQKRPFVENDDEEINFMSSPEKRLEVSSAQMVRINTFNSEKLPKTKKAEILPKKPGKILNEKTKSSSTEDIKIKKKTGPKPKNNKESLPLVLPASTPQITQDEFLPYEAFLPKGKESISKKNSKGKKEIAPLTKEEIFDKSTFGDGFTQFDWGIQQNPVSFDSATMETESQLSSFVFKIASNQAAGSEKDTFSQVPEGLIFAQEGSEYQFQEPISSVTITKIEEGGTVENNFFPSTVCKKKERVPKRIQIPEIKEQPEKKERKLNKLQMIKFAYQTYIEELRKPYTIDIHINPENKDQKIVETKIGENCQLDLNTFNPVHRMEQTKKKLAPVWNPDQMHPVKLENYFYRFGQIIGQQITNESAMLKNLVQFDMDVEKALENIKKHKIFFRNSFRLDQRVLRTRGGALPPT